MVPTVPPIRSLWERAYLTMTGEIVPNEAAGRKKRTPVTKRDCRTSQKETPDPPLLPMRKPINKSRKRIPNTRRDAANNWGAMIRSGAYVSAHFPPIQFPALIPASTTPMTPVQVKREFPKYLEMMRLAASSMIITPMLERNTTMWGRFLCVLRMG
jgi:hypothetical protein